VMDERSHEDGVFDHLCRSLMHISRPSPKSSLPWLLFSVSSSERRSAEKSCSRRWFLPISQTRKGGDYRVAQRVIGVLGAPPPQGY
jgi:hypothetical protein